MPRTQAQRQRRLKGKNGRWLGHQGDIAAEPPLPSNFTFPSSPKQLEQGGNFWAQLARPFTVLAPMEDVTDLAFRTLMARWGRPHVFFTEFIQASRFNRGERTALQRARASGEHHPLVVQLWDPDGDQLYRAALTLGQRGHFAGIDLNMGCPERSVVKKGCGSGLICQPERAKDHYQALVQGAVDAAGPGQQPIPVSVKTRMGFESPDWPWLEEVLSWQPAALTLHGRVATQMSEGQADWSWVPRLTALRDQLSPATLIIGNGDIFDPETLDLRSASGVDGVMVGRGVFHRPDIFLQPSQQFWPRDHRARLAMALDHVLLYQGVWAYERNFNILKKFFKIYLMGYDPPEPFVTALMASQGYGEARTLIETQIEKMGVQVPINH